MGWWMIDEAAANRFVRSAPLVSRRRGGLEAEKDLL
jgi:hypothetical protein